MSEIDDADRKLDKLCELNIVEQVLNVGETTIVQDAWARGQTVLVHGWIYDLRDGIISDLDIHLENRVDTNSLRKRFLYKANQKEAGETN